MSNLIWYKKKNVVYITVDNAANMAVGANVLNVLRVPCFATAWMFLLESCTKRQHLLDGLLALGQQSFGLNVYTWLVLF